MLNRSISVRVDSALWQFLATLAKDADRKPAALIRDLIFLMTFDDQLGQEIVSRIRTEQISYNK